MEADQKQAVRHFSVSALSKYWRCPEIYNKMYVAKSIEKTSSIPMAVGIAGHAGLECGYKAVLDGKRPSLPAMILSAEMSFRKELPRVQRPGIITDADLYEQNIDKIHKVMGVSFRDLVLRVKPFAVERKFEIEWRPGWVWRGAIDLICVERTASGYRIRDFKVGGARSPDPNSARDSIQLRMYSIAWEKLHGIKILDACLDHYVDSPKKPHITTRETSFTQANLDAVKLKIDRTLDAIESGQFGPGDPFWVCNEGRCEYFNSCEMGAGRAS